VRVCEVHPHDWFPPPFWIVVMVLPGAYTYSVSQGAESI
jgi:hypothetical protein